MNHLDLAIEKESRRTEFALCAISGKMFGKEFALLDIVPKNPVALLVGSINIDQRLIENVIVEDENNSSTYKTHDNTNKDVSFCDKIESDGSWCTIDDTNKKGSKSSNVKFCERTTSNDLSSTIDNTKKKGIRVQKSALKSKYKRYLLFTILKDVQVHRI